MDRIWLNLELLSVLQNYFLSRMNPFLSSHYNYHQMNPSFSFFRDMRHVFIVEMVAIAGLLIMLFGYRFIRVG